MKLTTVLQKVGDMTKKFANFPEEYVKRSLQQTYWETPKGKPQYLPRTVEKKRFRFTTNRSWTGQFRQQNMSGTIRKKVFIEPIETWSYFRGDRVEVLVGRDKGKQGLVTQVIQERNWVFVEGMNCHHRKVGSDGEYPGVLINSESPLLVTDQVALVDPSDLQSTPIEWRFTEEGERVRISTRTGRLIPIPKLHDETHDYKTKSTYIEKEKDTISDVVTAITFEPKLQTFEMNIMEELKIQENRIPKKTYWY